MGLRNVAVFAGGIPVGCQPAWSPLLYHSQPCVCVCVVSMLFSECAGKKIVRPTESLIICFEGMGAGVQRGIWHVHQHCFDISSPRGRTGSANSHLLSQ